MDCGFGPHIWTSVIISWAYAADRDIHFFDTKTWRSMWGPLLINDQAVGAVGPMGSVEIINVFSFTHLLTPICHRRRSWPSNGWIETASIRFVRSSYLSVAHLMVGQDRCKSIFATWLNCCPCTNPPRAHLDGRMGHASFINFLYLRETSRTSGLMTCHPLV